MLIKQRYLAVAVAIGILAASSPVVYASTFFVETYGVDGPECGTRNAPCRTISKAIEAADDGDRILVGPGRYGNLNGDFVFQPSQGEEAGQVGTGCECMILIPKRLILESSAGAGATVIDASGAAVIHAVLVDANGVVFGRRDRGFTIAGTIQNGVAVSNVTNVQIESNFATAGATGIALDGQGNLLRNNVAHSGISAGFVITGVDHRVSGNLSTRNHLGFDLHGSGHHLSGNVATGNNVGMVISGGASQIDVSRNIIAGNRQAGIAVAFSQGLDIVENNIYGNGVLPDVYLGTGLLNCGIANSGGGTLRAPRNFWGGAGGPGLDGADAICNAGTHTTNPSPVAPQPFNIPVQAGR